MSTRLNFLILINALLSSSYHGLSQSPGQLKEITTNTTVHFANNIDFTKDGNYFVVVVGFNADVYQKKEDGFKMLQTISGGNWQAYNPGISDDGSFVCFSNYEDTYVYKRTGDRYSLFQTINHAGAYTNKDLVMRFTGNDKLMVIGGAGNIRFYSLGESSFSEVKRVTNPDNLVFQYAALSASGQQMATIDVNGDVHCWKIVDENAQRGNALLRTNKYTGMVDITDDLILAAGATDSMNLYKVNADRNAMTQFFTFDKDKFGEIAFNPDGNRIMVANQSGLLSVYKIAGNLVSLESVNKRAIDNFTSLRMSNDAKWIAASSSGGKTISFFEAPERIMPAKQSTAKKTTPNAKAAPAKPGIQKATPAAVAKVPAPAAKLLSDKWIFKDIVDKEKLDSTILYRTNRQYRRTEMEFFSDGKFLYNPLGDNPYSLYQGTWALNKAENKVTTIVSHPETGEKITSEWEIKSLSAKELTLDFGNGVIVFSRPQTEKDIRESEIKAQLKKQLKFSEGLAAVQINEKWGFIDATGKEIIQFKYDFADNFNGGLAMVRDGTYPNYKHGFIDKKGNEVIPLIYDKVGIFTDGLTSVSIDDKYGFIDKKGKEVIPLTYGGTWDFREGLAMVRNGPYGIGKCGFIDRTGKEIIPLKYEQGDVGFKEGLALVVLNRRYGFIDKAGNEIIPLKYDFAFSFREGLAVVALDKKWGFIDNTGKEITPLKYDEVGKGEFAEGLALVRLNGKYGFINKMGKEILPLIYDNAYSFTQGLASVKLNGKRGFIDKTGKIIIALNFENASSFREGLASVKLNDKWGFIDKKGNVMIPFLYDSASGFTDGKAEVELNNETFSIDKKGIRTK